jgi:hypothetical protein
MTTPAQLRRFFLLWMVLAGAAVGAAEAQMVCQNGRGSLTAELENNVTVTVDAPHAAGFAQRICQARIADAKLSVAVTDAAAEVDADAVGVEMGLGGQVAAFQLRGKANDTSMSYVLYSLKRPFQKLRTLTGGDQYLAADTDMDGRVEIWTSDAAAFEGLDGMRLAAFDSAPLVVLRFEKQKLLDVGAEFLAVYDKRIAAARAALDPEGVTVFRATDGRMATIRADQFSQLRALLTTKVRVLEMAAGYLWSGREAESDRVLEEFWPARDQERIRQVLRDARARGLRAQVDGVAGAAVGKPHHTEIYKAKPIRTLYSMPQGMIGTGRAGLTMTEFGELAAVSQVERNPVSIEMYLPVPNQAEQVPAPPRRVRVQVLIDAAGKVREFKTLGDPEPALEASSASWKFIPGYRSGHPVACWMTMDVWPQQ